MFKMKYPTPEVSQVDLFIWTVKYTPLHFTFYVCCCPHGKVFLFFSTPHFSSYKRIPKQTADYVGSLWGKIFAIILKLNSKFQVFLYQLVPAIQSGGSDT